MKERKVPNWLKKEEKHEIWLKYLDSYMKMQPITYAQLAREHNVSISQIKNILDDERFRYRSSLMDEIKIKGIPNDDEIAKLAWLVIIEALYNGDVQVAKQIVNNGIKLRTRNNGKPPKVKSDTPQEEDYSSAAAVFVSDDEEDDDGNEAPNVHNG